MTDEKANRILYEFGEKNRPEEFKTNGKIDYELWIRTFYKRFCKKFGSKPKKFENHLITRQREIIATDVYAYDKKKTGIITVSGELGLKRRKEAVEQTNKIIKEYFSEYID